MMARQIARPPSVSMMGLARFATRAHLSPSCCTAVILASKRRRISSSSVKALTTRRPCSVSCNVSIVCVSPVNCTLMIARTRFTILRSMMMAGGEEADVLGQELVERAPLVVGDDAVSDPHHDDLLTVSRGAFQREQPER